MKPWPAGTECPAEGYQTFKSLLDKASFHNASEFGEQHLARSARQQAAKVAVEEGWPYWAMERMWGEIKPLETWSTFMQNYIDIMKEKH